MRFGPYLEMILVAIIWSGTGPFLKYLNLPPTTTTFIRMLIPTIILLTYLLFKGTTFLKKTSKEVVGASLLNAIRLWLIFAAFAFTTISNTYIVFYTWPIFASIFAFFILKEKLSKKSKVLLMLPFIGVIFIYTDTTLTLSNNHFLGISAALLSAMLYALSIILFKKETKKFTRSQIVFYQNIFGCFLFLPFIIINQPLPTPTQLVEASIWALLVGVVGFMLFFSAIKKVKAATVSSIAYLEVALAIIWGIILFNEPVTLPIVVGGSLIIVSTILLKNEANAQSQSRVR